MKEFRIENFGYVNKVEKVVAISVKNVQVELKDGLILDFSQSINNGRIEIELMIGVDTVGKVGHWKRWHQQAFEGDLKEWWKRFREYCYDKNDVDCDTAIAKVVTTVQKLFVK